ncbi:MAG: hypothetical protein QGI21_02555 [Candidatus Poseidoniaceae archaeon]|jgi:hypothetical protein|nr:hypothetical protein [Candidatus Poseidoniaceae archaeon]
MKENIRFSELTPTTGLNKPMNERYETHIVSGNDTWDWKPISIETPATWNSLARRARGEA